MLTATDRYLARLIAVPMLGTLVIAAMLLVLDKMLSLFDFVAAEGGPVSVVWRMLANMLPEYLSLGIPIGLMLGILLAFRKLALSSELDVMRAVGLSYGRLLRVPYLYCIALALLNFGIVGFVQPLSRHAYEALRFELRSGALGASIKVGEFTNLGKRMTMRIERSKDEGRNLQGIFVRAVGKDGQSVAVTAAQGTFLATDDPDVIIFRLRNGVLVNDGPKYKTPRILSFSSHDLPIDLPQIENFRGRDVDREKTIPELMVIGRSPATPDKLKAEVRANFHFRMVEVVFMFLLPLAALAFAIPPKRSTSALGVFLSIIFIVTYHKINQYGEGIGALGKVDPIIALWGPFLLASGLVLWMYHVIANRPGGQPIGALEVAFSKLGKQIVRLLRVGRRRAPADADVAGQGAA
ncbi:MULTISPECIES: LPS export ABC transporter permease LptF [Sphingobium]|jgi:lipopolysaccharide export system permease protein|uniref:LPS export ABC transporter permease LptF n=1 Tax=Sphingobium TaxID=165695 RepID=UPI000DBAFAB2|nr:MULTISPECIES: LPS export ABC transporter permease LptF [Sphingobium]KAA9014154.1 LPS export ABC transporter permease LptF [Sphingobium limneticum]MBU0931225.1 LPS export ABC transporter permease LptF [Alphaproteobacteria bacterium]BBC99032.1 lipopolysaccharide export system permease protein [Sphingobium sp. YG1]